MEDARPRLRPPVLVLLGPPGAGKRTQARKLGEDRGLARLAERDLRPADDDRAAERGPSAGAPGAALRSLLEGRLAVSAAQGLVLEGLPRGVAEAADLDALLAERGLKVDAAILLTLDAAAAAARLAGRLRCTDCGDPPAPAGAPPEVFETFGGTPSTRGAEATEAAVAAEHAAFATAMGPLLDHYRERGTLLRVNAARPIEDVALALGGVLRALR